MRKQAIPTALRRQVWIRQCGEVFEAICPTPWCRNRITVFDFHVAHDVPESRGGPTILSNLVPLCAQCNLSMGDT